MKKCVRSDSNTNYLSGIYTPGQRRFLSQPASTLTVGGRLRRERLLRKLTLEEMSTFLGITSTYLGAIERGQRPVSRKLGKVLHDKLGMSYDFLLEGMSVTGTMISQYVREASNYSLHHNLHVLLNVCEEDELKDCYNLIHTYLSNHRTPKVASKTPEYGAPTLRENEPSPENPSRDDVQ